MIPAREPVVVHLLRPAGVPGPTAALCGDPLDGDRFLVSRAMFDRLYPQLRCQACLEYLHA